MKSAPGAWWRALALPSELGSMLPQAVRDDRLWITPIVPMEILREAPSPATAMRPRAPFATTDPAVCPARPRRSSSASGGPMAAAGAARAGAGLGLAIVASIVTAHGGRATAANAPGGAVFTARLPARAAGAPKPEPEPAGATRSSAPA
jgi:hypothetical protein